MREKRDQAEMQALKKKNKKGKGRILESFMTIP